MSLIDCLVKKESDISDTIYIVMGYLRCGKQERKDMNMRRGRKRRRKRREARQTHMSSCGLQRGLDTADFYHIQSHTAVIAG